MKKPNILDRVTTLLHLLKVEDQADFLIAILSAAIIANGSIYLQDIGKLILVLLLGSLVLGGNTILNQYYDVEIDRINKPYRPLPSGKIKPRTVLYLTITFFIISIVISIYLGVIFFIATILGIIAGLLYSHPEKSRKKGIMSIISGSIIVCLGYVVIGFVLGWAIYKPITMIPLWFLVFLFVTDIGGFFAKDYRDYKGDKYHSYATLPTVLGYKKAARINMGLYVAPFIALLLLALSNVINIRFVILAIYCILTGIYAFSLLLKKEDKRNAILCYYIMTSNFMMVRILSVWILVM